MVRPWKGIYNIIAKNRTKFLLTIILQNLSGSSAQSQNWLYLVTHIYLATGQQKAHLIKMRIKHIKYKNLYIGNVRSSC